MEDACYICHRTRSDLGRLNEEIRTRVYLAYFTNTRAQLDDEQRKIVFLQRLKDEESGDAHFRINAAQVFGDPPAYQKLMPWIDRLIEIVHALPEKVDEKLTMGQLVDQLLVDERHAATRLEQALDQLRNRFTTGPLPVSLQEYTVSFPVDWSMEGSLAHWRANPPGAAEPLRSVPGSSRSQVEVTIHLCSVCRNLTESK